jgi:putative Holliday junction resolvase
MGKVLALDYGMKRIGIAITDELRIIASPLTTVDTPKIWEFLTQLLNKDKIDCFVLGEPRRLNNEISDTTEKVYAFKKLLEAKFPDKTVYLLDERFTSKIATQSMLQNGMKKKDRQNKALIDTISATLILQNFLEQHR